MAKIRNSATRPTVSAYVVGVSPAVRAEAVYRGIHDAIVAHRLPPGCRLPEEQIAAAFGVSRTVVRQALQRLAHERLVVQEPNRGVRIAEPSIAEVRQMFELRRLLECALIRQASGRLTRARIAVLKRLVAQEARANAAGDVHAAMQRASEFHLELAASLANPLLDNMLRELMALGNVAIAVYEHEDRSTCRCSEHRQIIGYLAEGDMAAAEGAMATHIEAIEAGLTTIRSVHVPIDVEAALKAIAQAGKDAK